MSIPFYGDVELNNNLSIKGNVVGSLTITETTITKYLQIQQPRWNIGQKQYPGLTDHPGSSTTIGWNRVPSGLFVYNDVDADVDQNKISFINKPGGANWFNMLHINGYSPDTIEHAGIMQIAGDFTGRLFFRNGNKNGWYNSPSIIGGWREIIDNNGGQTINGDLTIAQQLQCPEGLKVNNWTQIQDANNYTLHQTMLSTATYNEMTGDLNTKFAGTYGQFTTANTSVQNHFPLYAAGMMHVIHTLSGNPQAPNSNINGANNKGATQIYYPNSGRGFFTRAKPWGWDDFEDWCAHRPHNVLADYVYYKYPGNGDDITVDLTGKIQVGQSVFIQAITEDAGALNYYVTLNLPGSYIGWMCRTVATSDHNKAQYKTYINEAITAGDSFLISGGAPHAFMMYLIRVW